MGATYGGRSRKEIRWAGNGGGGKWGKKHPYIIHNYKKQKKSIECVFAFAFAFFFNYVYYKIIFFFNKKEKEKETKAKLEEREKKETSVRSSNNAKVRSIRLWGLIWV